MAVARYFSFLPDGRLVGASKTVQGAAQELRDAGFTGNTFIEDVGKIEGTVRQNPAPKLGKNMGNKALHMAGLRPITRAEVEKYTSIEEAFAEISPITRHAVMVKKGVKSVPKTMTNAKAFVKALLGGNYKMNMRSDRPASQWSPVEDASSKGLSLIPAGKLSRFTQEFGGQARTAMARAVVKLIAEVNSTVSGGKYTVCLGSSNLCRDTCLVFSGQNEGQKYNARRKAALTVSLMLQPAAFLYLLREAIHQYITESRLDCTAKTPFVRLNVYSDLPWELLAPWLFEDIERMDGAVYDYTKLGGRRPPKGYDLTFSYSGTNEQLCISESETKRVAVVMLAHEIRKGKWHELVESGERMVPSGAMLNRIVPDGKLWGMPIIDGDAHDFRPFDPPSHLSLAPGKRVIVGLSYKIPQRGAKRSEKAIHAMRRSAMIIPAYAVDGTPGDKRSLKWIVAPVTPPNEPIPDRLVTG